MGCHGYGLQAGLPGAFVVVAVVVETLVCCSRHLKAEVAFGSLVKISLRSAMLLADTKELRAAWNLATVAADEPQWRR